MLKYNTVKIKDSVDIKNIRNMSTNYNSFLEQYPVFTIEEEREVFKKIEKGHKSKILTFKKTGDFDTPLPDFEIIFSTISAKKSGIKDILKLYDYFKANEEGNKIVMAYLNGYLALYHKLNGIPNFTDLKNAFINGEYNYFTDFSSTKVIDNIDKRIDTLIEYYKNRDLAIKSNMRLAIKVACGYAKLYDAEDLIIEASRGLMKAVDVYDINKGFKFSTYATWWIRQSVTRSIFNQSRTIRIPVYAHEFMSKIKVATDSLQHELKRDPSDVEIANKLRIKPEKLADFKNYTQLTSSLDVQVLDNAEDTLGDIIEDNHLDTPEQYSNKILLKEELNKALLLLNDVERTIVIKRFGLNGEEPITLNEIGLEYNLSKERIRQIEYRALKKLKNNENQKANLECFLYR